MFYSIALEEGATSLKLLLVSVVISQALTGMVMEQESIGVQPDS